MFCYANLEDFC